LQYTQQNSVECVSNQMNGAVMIETTFMGIATALAITSGWFNPILLGNNSLKQEKSQNYNHYTHGNGRA
jgi:hypothetical protein